METGREKSKGNRTQMVPGLLLLFRVSIGSIGREETKPAGTRKGTELGEAGELHGRRTGSRSRESESID